MKTNPVLLILPAHVKIISELDLSTLVSVIRGGQSPLEELQIMTWKPYLGDRASVDEGGFVCGLGGWNEWRRRGNVRRSRGSVERHADSVI